MRFPFIRFDQRGATAIEYALIAGLIGLGLIASLVTTRGSLAGVFGTASNQMGSASEPVAQGSIDRPTFWSSKTQSQPVENGGTYMRFRFTDGSVVLITKSYPRTFSVEDPSSFTKYNLTVNSSGNMEYFLTRNYTDSSFSTLVRQENTDGGSGNWSSDGKPLSYSFTQYENGLSTASGTNVSPTTLYLSKISSGNLDYQYFAALAKY